MSISDIMDCGVFVLPWLLSLSGGHTKCSGRSWCLPLPGGVPLPFEGESVPLFYSLLALETSRSIPEPDVRTPQACGSEVGKRALGKGGGGKLKLEESQTAIAGDR